MSYALRTDASLARRHLEAFWNGDSLGRPAMKVLVKDPAYVEEKKFPLEFPEGLSLIEHELWPPYQAWTAADSLRRHLYLAEAMPAAHVSWGSMLTALACLAGGTYEYHDSAWIRELPDILDRPLPRYDANCPVIHLMDAAYAAARQAVGDAGFITPPLMMDGLSTLAMFRGADKLCLDIIDRPDWVKAWSASLNDLYIKAYEHYYQMLGYEESWCFCGPVAHGRSEGVQCDFAVNLSPAMYEQFVLDDLRRVTDYFDRSLYHLDGTCQLRFLDLLRRMPKLSGIQWNPETTAGSPLKWLDALREIRRRNFCLMVWFPGDSTSQMEQAVALTQELGPDGLFLILPTFDTIDEAKQAIDRIARAC